MRVRFYIRILDRKKDFEIPNSQGQALKSYLFSSLEDGDDISFGKLPISDFFISSVVTRTKNRPYIYFIFVTSSEASYKELMKISSEL